VRGGGGGSVKRCLEDAHAKTRAAVALFKSHRAPEAYKLLEEVEEHVEEALLRLGLVYVVEEASPSEWSFFVKPYENRSVVLCRVDFAELKEGRPKAWLYGLSPDQRLDLSRDDFDDPRRAREQLVEKFGRPLGRFLFMWLAEKFGAERCGRGEG
jgi:hypothetical protein